MKFKENSMIKNLKEKKAAFDVIWSNPRYKAIIKLSFWFVLIFILSLFVRVSNKQVINEPIREVVIENDLKGQLKSINSYEAVITIETSDFIHILNKQVLNDEELINYQGSVYYYNGLFVDNDFINSTIFFNIKNVYTLIENYDEEYTTKYKDGSYISCYKVPVSLFHLLYYNENIESEDYINIIIEGNENINKITMDLDYNDNIKKVIIELSNINNIEEIYVGE